MVRPLSRELQRIAVTELNEDPRRVEDDIKHIQEWIKQQPHLNAPTDKQWILGFLRGCKFSLQKTKEKINMFYFLITVVPELTKPRDVFSIEIQAMLKAGLMLPVPSSKNYAGPTVVLGRFHNYDKNIMNLEDMTAFFAMVNYILIREDDNLMVSGIIFWIDLEHFPLNLLYQLTPTYLKTIITSIECAIPVRVKLIIGTGSHSLAQRIFNLMKVFMGPKLSSRVLIHNTDEFEEIFKIIPKSHIPEEYGGENSNLQDITDFWKKKVENNSSWYTEILQYGTNEALRPGKPASFDDVVGIDGSFRKLNID